MCIRDSVTRYRFYAREACEVIVRLTALNDPPEPNTYDVVIAGATNAPSELVFDLENGRLSTLETEPQHVAQGVNGLQVRYHAATHKEAREAGKTTEEAVQNNGIARIAIVPH